MGLIVLTLIGAVLGWLATIILRVEESRQIIPYVLAGVAGSLLVGVIVGSGLVMGGMSAMALLWATLGAIAAIAGFSLFRHRSFS